MFDGDEHTVHVRDLSAGGAQLECDRPPPVQAIVTYKGNSGRHTARVAWATGTKVGLQFLERLSAEAVGAELAFNVAAIDELASEG